MKIKLVPLCDCDGYRVNPKTNLGRQTMKITTSSKDTCIHCDHAVFWKRVTLDELKLLEHIKRK